MGTCRTLGSVDELRRLLSGGSDIDARDRHGQTALMIAAAAGSADTVAWLVKQGAALDRTAKFGLSAVMLAVVRGNVEVVRILTEAGADLGLRGTGATGFADKTALDLAVARGSREIIEIPGSRQQGSTCQW